MQESGSSVHLVELLQRGEHRVEFEQVKARRDLDVGNHSLGHPAIYGAGADRQAFCQFLLLDQGGLNEA
ncbi:MAG: hypothetical protein RLZZ214_3812 [Verrucomicrobiota bacterium]